MIDLRQSLNQPAYWRSVAVIVMHHQILLFGQLFDDRADTRRRRITIPDHAGHDTDPCAGPYEFMNRGDRVRQHANVVSLLVQLLDRRMLGVVRLDRDPSQQIRVTDAPASVGRKTQNA